MLTQIDVVYGNELGEQALALPILGVTPKESLLIRKVTGLNPPDRDLFIGDYARDGGNYTGSRVGNRNVVMTIDLNPNPALGETISGLRDLLYKTFMDPLIDADHVELVLHDDDGGQRNLFGYAERFETEIFDVETLAQISMICPDPYIRDLMLTQLLNASGTWLSVPFTYGGTAETGFEAEIRMSVTSTTVTLRNNTKYMVFEGADMTSAHTIYVNTNRGSRQTLIASTAQVDSTRAANPTWTLSQLWSNLKATAFAASILPKLRSDSTWIELHSQANTLQVYGSTPATTVAGIKALEFRQSYWGV